MYFLDFSFSRGEAKYIQHVIAIVYVIKLDLVSCRSDIGMRYLTSFVLFERILCGILKSDSTFALDTLDTALLFRYI